NSLPGSGSRSPGIVRGAGGEIASPSVHASPSLKVVRTEIMAEAKEHEGYVDGPLLNRHEPYYLRLHLPKRTAQGFKSRQHLLRQPLVGLYVTQYSGCGRRPPS